MALGDSEIVCSPSSFLYIAFIRLRPFNDTSYNVASLPIRSLHLLIHPSRYSLANLTLSHDIILLNSTNFDLLKSLSLCKNSSISRSE